MPEPRWIPVQEALPAALLFEDRRRPRSAEVAFLVSGREARIGRYLPEFKELRDDYRVELYNIFAPIWSADGRTWDPDDVTHWLPLPPLPESS